MAKVKFITGDELSYTVSSKSTITKLQVTVGEGITAKTINVIVKEGEKEADKVALAIRSAFPALEEAITVKEEEEAIKLAAKEEKEAKEEKKTK